MTRAAEAGDVQGRRQLGHPNGTVSPSVGERTLLFAHLAIVREVRGRASWEPTLMPHPVEGRYATYVSRADRLIQDGAPYHLCLMGTIRPETLPEPLAGRVIALTQDLHGLAPSIDAAISEPARTEALLLREQRVASAIQDTLPRLHLAVGASAPSPIERVLVVPWGPHPPSVGFLEPRRPLAGGWIAANRYGSEADVQLALTLQLGAALALDRDGLTLRRRLRDLFAQPNQDQQRLCRVAEKILLGLTAAHIGREWDHVTVDLNHRFGLSLRYPRLFDPLAGRWSQWLEGRATLDTVWRSVAELLVSEPAWWFVDHLDAAAIAADFYLLEAMAAGGDHDADRALASWEPELADWCAEHLAFAIGAELDHMARVDADRDRRLRDFLRGMGQQHSLLTWHQVYEDRGAEALALASAAFSGPGIEFGGEAWAPYPELLARFGDGTINRRVFIDQCFSLEHNNGNLFDKMLATAQLPRVLDAQAVDDLDTLAAHASHDVRRLFEAPPHAGERTTLGVRAPGVRRLGAVGCGSRHSPQEAPGRRAEHPREAMELSRRVGLRAKRRISVPQALALVVRTSHGELRIRLHRHTAPDNVNALVGLATGTREWTEPHTQTRRSSPFYDGLAFHRLVPGFLAQTGDRRGDGRGGPGFRTPDEESALGSFDRAGIVAMANRGPNTNGSQFFITAAPAPHLDGGFCIIGDLALDDAASHTCLEAIVAARRAWIERVSVDWAT